VNIDHLQATTGATGGPISWITSGKVDAVFDIKFPHDAPGDVDIPAFLSEIASNVAAAAGAATEGIGIPSFSLTDRIPGQHELAKPALRPPDAVVPEAVGVDKHQVIIDIDLRFRDLKAAVPYFPSELGYVNNALIRPIVAFIKYAKCFF
jgi:distribution and morphology protein 31